MKKLLHIIATPRGEESRTLQVTAAFLERFKKKYPDCKIDELNLTAEALQPFTARIVSGKYVLLGGKELTESLKDTWKNIEYHINRFLSADGYLITAPMWNFSIPYSLKHYIDIIVQPKYLFRYTDKGVEGLAKNRRMAVITSRGGDYSQESPFHAYDFQEPYLRFIFGFVGITDITFVNSQPMDMGEQTQKEKIEAAKELARKAADAF
ncbi:ACP phosphodiesterase [bacterium]|nr:MAG: ACP phosphodiesterase [bacterium]